MEVARTIRELYEKCDKDIRNIFGHLTKGKVHGAPFEDLVHTFYLKVWQSNMYRGGFEFGDPAAEACFDPYIYTFAKRFHRNYCQQLFGKKDEETGKGIKQVGWTNTSTIRDFKGKEVEVFSVAVGAGFSHLCPGFSVSTSWGGDYVWGDSDPCEAFRMDDFKKVLMRSTELLLDEKALVLSMVDRLQGGMDMTEVVDMQGTDKSSLYKLRRQARTIMTRYRSGAVR